MAVNRHLTILCITRGDEHAEDFVWSMLGVTEELGFAFMLACDGDAAARLADRLLCPSVDVRSDGYLESVLDAAVWACDPGYILRLDDDERMSPAMVEWLAHRNYLAGDHWTFARMNLWPDTDHYITTAPLWPDIQTRLSIKEKSGSRPRIHDASPYGSGKFAPVAIEHHKFLVRTREERQATLERYESLQPGAGSGHYAPFSLPELLPDLQVAAR